jgi:hypothetical protein
MNRWHLKDCLVKNITDFIETLEDESFPESGVQYELKLRIFIDKEDGAVQYIKMTKDKP